MKIIIKYSDVWKNSFLDGDNNSKLPKNGRKFIASITSLGKKENAIYRDFTIDTIMGVMNRLIGDQRKLWQSREKVYSDFYYFEDIEKNISFVDDIKTLSKEVVFLRNMNKSYDKGAWSGKINVEHPLLNSKFSKRLFSIFYYSLEELYEFILTGNEVDLDSLNIDLDPLLISEQISLLDKIKAEPINERLKNIINVFTTSFEEDGILPKYYLKNENEVYNKKFYFSALYLLTTKMILEFGSELENILNSKNGIPGMSKGGFTQKDFIANFANKKLIYGNPYLINYWDDNPNKEGKKIKVEDKLGVATGTLTINIDVDREKSKEIKTLIENAGVGYFYLGKKGLAYVDKIKL